MIARDHGSYVEDIIEHMNYAEEFINNMTFEEFKKSTLAGTPEECCEHFKMYLDLGVTYFMLYFADLPSIDGLRLFYETVAKKI